MEKITYDWLKLNDFHVLERLERQPYDVYRRCIAADQIGDRFMVADEDLCIDVSPDRMPNPDFWFVFLSRASAQNRQASVFLHSRHMVFVDEIMLLYEALTGRTWGPKHWRTRELGKPLFEHPERQCWKTTR